MNITKKQIMDSSMHLFAHKGYYATSMQEIAEDCGIAKGSIYKYFQSKEELFLEIFDACHNEMMQQAYKINGDDALSPKEKLSTSIEFQLGFFMENSFIMLEITDLPIRDNERFEPLKERAIAQVRNWRKECLLHAYGDPSLPYLEDILTIFTGIFKQYLHYVVQAIHPLALKDVARFIVDRMDVIVADLLSAKPAPLIHSALGEDGGAYLPTSLEALQEMVNTMRSIAEELPMTNSARQELTQMLIFLQNEIAEQAPRMFLIRPILYALEEKAELQSYVRHFLTVFNRTS
jgi:AcrR family transcriptional regulator